MVRLSAGVVLATLLTSANATRAPSSAATKSAAAAVDSFAALEHAVGSTVSSISLTAAEKIVFPHQIHVQRATALSIESSIGTTLSGGGSNRLFFLANETKLHLRGVALVQGRCSGCPGGAIFLSSDSELTLTGSRISFSEAFLGGAIYSLGSSVVRMTNCALNSNSATLGGSVYAAGDSIVSATDCTMTLNSALMGGGAVVADDRSILTTTSCWFTLNSARTGSVNQPGLSSATCMLTLKCGC